MIAHTQKPDFVFRRNGRVHLNRPGASVQSTTGSRGVCISGSNAGYTMFRSRVKSTGYPLHSPVSPSLPLPCVTVCHHVSTALYLQLVQHPKFQKRPLVRMWCETYSAMPSDGPVPTLSPNKPINCQTQRIFNL